MDILAKPPLSASIVSILTRRAPFGRYRLMFWFCSKWNPPAFIAKLPGSKTDLLFECDHRNFIAREVYFTGLYEPQEIFLLKMTLKSSDVCVDVGSNWGFFALWAAELVGPSGKVLAIEADPRIYQTLEHNCTMNSLSNLVPLHIAISSERGKLRLVGFNDEHDNWGTSHLDFTNELSSNRFEVDSSSLDEVLDDQGVERVDLLKMDIEGAEVQALIGMKRGLSSGRYRKILLELHPNAIKSQGFNIPTTLKPLIDSGYRGLKIRHSQADIRKIAYSRHPRVEDMIAPIDLREESEPWAHQIWFAPEEEKAYREFGAKHSKVH